MSGAGGHRRGGRTGVHEAISVNATRVLERSRWRRPTTRRISPGIPTSGGTATGCSRTAHGGVIISGRSDATLNPGGVRIGTAEIYRQVEQLPEIAESVAVGAEVRGADGGYDTEVVLFVRLAPGVELDDALRGRLRDAIRRNTSPHHVPRRIHAVADIPRTVSGKIAELAVREAIHGRAAGQCGRPGQSRGPGRVSGIRQVARFIEDGYSGDRPRTGVRRGCRAGAHDHQVAVHRSGSAGWTALHRATVRALQCDEPRCVAPPVFADGGPVAGVCQRPVPAGDRFTLPAGGPGAAARGRQPVSRAAHGVPGEGGERIRPGVRVLRLPAQARVPDDDHDPRRRVARLPTRAGHLPRHRRPRADAHRPGVRRYTGPVRRLCAYGGSLVAADS